MGDMDWDSKVVIGSKGKVPKVTRTTSDLNGELYRLWPCLASSD